MKENKVILTSNKNFLLKISIPLLKQAYQNGFVLNKNSNSVIEANYIYIDMGIDINSIDKYKKEVYSNQNPDNEDTFICYAISADDILKEISNSSEMKKFIKITNYKLESIYLLPLTPSNSFFEDTSVIYTNLIPKTIDELSIYVGDNQGITDVLFLTLVNKILLSRQEMDFMSFLTLSEGIVANIERNKNKEHNLNNFMKELHNKFDKKTDFKVFSSENKDFIKSNLIKIV